MASDRNSEGVQEAGQSGISAEKNLPKSEEKKKEVKRENNTEEDNGDKGTPDNNRRLWVGNLSPKLTELRDSMISSNLTDFNVLFYYGFHLLKLVQRFGSIENFDFLFHRTGPNAGLPRGYAFITYNTAEDAKKCLEGLDGKRILDRVLSVRYAHQTTQAFMDEEERLRKKLPALGMKLEAEPKPVSKERAISAIEAKLRAMEREKDEVGNFSLTAVGSSQNTAIRHQPVTRNYQYASRSASQYDATRNRTRPYSRYAPKKRF